MTADLQPYPEYKDSGLPWIGRIPSHWGLWRAKYLYREVDERSQTGEEELCSVSHKTGVTPRKENVTMFMAESTVGYKICRPNDLAINTLWAWMAALGVARQVGLVSPAYGVYRPHPDSELLPDFADKLLRIEEYKAEYIARSTGVNASRLRLYPDQFLRIPVLLPTREEQEGIARYLEGMDRSVRRFIRNRRRLIEVLNEQKQQLTQRAIASSTTKLHRLRDLVIDPKREVVRIQDQLYTPIGLYNWGRGIFHKTPTPGADLGDSVFYWVEEGDLVFSGQFAWEGAVSLARQKDHGCVASHRYPVFIGKTESVRTSYLEAFFQSGAGQLLMDANSRGAAGRNRPLNARALLREMIPVPSMDNQLAIEAFGNRLQKVSAVVAREIELVREYRTRLIADVVTGKVDVRGLAPTEPLPEESEPDVDFDEEGVPEDTDTDPGEEAADDVD
jgi:type I restriction enzyme, S subunit